jgi:hypothetical protein
MMNKIRPGKLVECSSNAVALLTIVKWRKIVGGFNSRPPARTS